jgi:DNA-damage-inducible protein J
MAQMTKTRDKMVHIRLDAPLKKEVEGILKKLGMTTSEAVYMFLNMVRNYKGLPFEVKIPNKTTRETFAKTDRGEELTTFESKEQLFDHLRSL